MRTPARIVQATATTSAMPLPGFTHHTALSTEAAPLALALSMLLGLTDHHRTVDAVSLRARAEHNVRRN